MRADARRNRDNILASARALVADAGVDATMEDIARDAGVAVGTLYRHFPAKEDLLAAVVDDSMEQLAAMTEAGLAEVERGAPPGPVVTKFFRSVAARYTEDRALKAAAGRLGVGVDARTTLEAVAAAEPGSGVVRAMGALSTLIERCVAAGQIRSDITLEDLVMMLDGVPGSEASEAMRERYVDIVIAGLTARP